MRKEWWPCSVSYFRKWCFPEMKRSINYSANLSPQVLQIQFYLWLGRYKLIIRFSSDEFAKDGAGGRFIFYILYFTYKLIWANIGAVVSFIPTQGMISSTENYLMKNTSSEYIETNITKHGNIMLIYAIFILYSKY